MVRGRPDGTWGGDYVFWKKKDYSANSDEKIVCSANCKKNKKFVHKTGRKMGLYGAKKIARSFAYEEKKVCFWLRVKKKVCTG